MLSVDLARKNRAETIKIISTGTFKCLEHFDNTGCFCLNLTTSKANNLNTIYHILETKLNCKKKKHPVYYCRYIMLLTLEDQISKLKKLSNEERSMTPMTTI